MSLPAAGRPALRFRRLDLRRTPGIATPFVIDDLCDGINITYGPNASGKTTTAQALQMLLWQGLDGWSRASLAGQIELHGSRWQVDIDAGAVECRQDGNPGARLPIDSAEFRDRYVLTLHDLLQADNADFAGIILRESAGGYDIDAASEGLGYRQTPPRPAGNISRLRSAQAATREAARAQHDLLREQQNLAQLREDLEAARQSSVDVAALERALAVLQRRRELEQAHETLALLPTGIGHLRGDELTRLDDIRKRRAGYEELERNAEADLQQAEREIADTRLAHVDLPSGFVAALRARGQQLQDLAGRLREAESAAAASRRQRDHAARQMSPQIDEAQIRRLEVSGLRDLLALAQRLEQARGDYAAADQLRTWLGEGGAYQDVERLREGISRLNAWLRSGDAPAAGSSSASLVPAGVASALLVLAALVAGLIGNPVLLVLIALAPVPLGLALVMRPKAVTTGRAGFARDEYAALGLEQPRAWNVEQVTALADRLSQDLRRQQLEQERAQRWAALEARWRQAGVMYREVFDEWQAALRSLGLPPMEPATLFLLAQNLDRWQQADAQLASALQRASDEREQFDQLLAKLDEDLARAGYAPSADHTTALGYIDDLDDRVLRLRQARQKLDAARNTLDQVVTPELERLDNERAGLFEALGLEPDDEGTLSEWLEQRDAFLTARDAAQQAELAVRHALSELGERAGLADRDQLALETELARLRADAERADELNRRIIEIETRIEQAKQARNLEQAIATETAARDTLRADRDEGYRLAAGWELADFVRRQTRDRDRPQVFHRARELFVRMTQGRYILQFADVPRPAFRAEDTTTGVVHQLAELSSATRVQLLMAVRMAFVEEMEQGPKLPLILDETLGNADEHRAEAIIRAVCEICRDGRQVFYFTAQHDEVGKWRRLLADLPDLPHRVVSLVEARQLPEFEPSSLAALPPTPPSVPAPDGADRLAYRAVLHVPDIDRDAAVEGVHLWYVIDDPAQLHRLLSLGISTWGQLKTLVDFGGDFVPQDVFDRARALAGVIDAGLRACRVGYGRPVDRAAVLDSEAFTAAFVDQVIQEAERADGDAETLLRRLDAGHVRRLRTDYIEAFRAYLVDEGYLDPEDPLPPGEIRARVLGAASADLASSLISREDVELVLHYLPVRDEEWPGSNGSGHDAHAGDSSERYGPEDDSEDDSYESDSAAPDGIEAEDAAPAYVPRLPQLRARREG